MAKRESERLFFALWPSDQVRKGLARIGRQYVGSGGRSVHPEDLHVTLLFLGQVDPGARQCLLAAADELSGRPFRLVIDSIDYWRGPGILWCGPAKTPAALLQLFEGLQRGAERCGFPPETRPYLPHVTLARKARPLAAEVLEKPLIWDVSSFALVRSQTGGEPPRYRVQKKWHLDS